MQDDAVGDGSCRSKGTRQAPKAGCDGGGGRACVLMGTQRSLATHNPTDDLCESVATLGIQAVTLIQKSISIFVVLPICQGWMAVL